MQALNPTFELIDAPFLRGCEKGQSLVVQSEGFMILRLIPVRENGFCGAGRRVLEGQGFRACVRTRRTNEESMTYRQGYACKLLILGGRHQFSHRLFSADVAALTHHFVVPPLPLAGEGSGERELAVTAGLKPRPSAAIFMTAKDLQLRSEANECRFFASLRMTNSRESAAKDLRGFATARQQASRAAPQDDITVGKDCFFRGNELSYLLQTNGLVFYNLQNELVF